MEEENDYSNTFFIKIKDQQGNEWFFDINDSYDICIYMKEYIRQQIRDMEDGVYEDDIRKYALFSDHSDLETSEQMVEWMDHGQHH